MQKFYGAPVKIHWVTRRDRATPSMLNRKDVSFLTPDEGQFGWSGNNSEWDMVIQNCLGSSPLMPIN